MLSGVRRRRHNAYISQRLVCAQAVGDESDQHADAGGAKTEVPANSLTEYSGDEGRHEGADVDPHIEDREARVATRSSFGVQVADDRRDVRLEQAGTKDDEDQPDEERRACEY